MRKDHLISAVRERIAQMDAALATLPDENAADAVTLFRKWAPGEDYAAGYRLQWDDKLYRVVQPHTSQAGWEPDKVPALFTEIPKPGEIPDWKQPTGAQDAYMAGDKVRHAGKIWVSDVDNNVWEPGIYGWREYTDN